jgi:WD40 repeat protein
VWLRSLESEVARPLAGTEGVESAFWSPDGQWLGLANADSVRRVHLSTGAVRTIADRRAIPQTRGVLWSSDDVILFGGEGASLQRISASGGDDPDVLYEFEEADLVAWLEGLKDGRHFFFSLLGRGRSGIFIGSVDGDPQRLLLERSFDQRSALFYAPPYLLYVDEGVLWAHPFDETTLSLSGDPVAVLEGIPKSGAGYVPVAVSSDVLAYWPRQTGYPSVLTWKDRSGAVLGRVGAPAIYSGLALSPDGDDIAFARFGELGDRDVWVRDSRGNEIRKTFDGDSTGPLFAFDGQRVLFSSARGAPPNLHVLPVTGAGDQRVAQSGLVQTARSWGRGQDLVVYEERDPVNGLDLWIHRLDDGSAERLSWNTTFEESYGRLSPDERWIAYVYDGSGQKEVWLASFPSGEVRRAVGRGTAPEWRRDGAELFYISADGDMTAVPIAAAESSLELEVGEPVSLFPVDVWPRFEEEAGVYAVTPDGDRFLVLDLAEDVAEPPIHVILNWQELLKAPSSN